MAQEFNKFEALNKLADFAKNPIVTVSEGYQYQTKVMAFLQDIHDKAYEKGFQDCLNTNFPEDAKSR